MSNASGQNQNDVTLELCQKLTAEIAPARTTLLTYFDTLKSQRLENQIYAIKVRIKDPSSLNRKLHKKRDEKPGEVYSVDKITDLVGVRIVAYYKESMAHCLDIIGKHVLGDHSTGISPFAPSVAEYPGNPKVESAEHRLGFEEATIYVSGGRRNRDATLARFYNVLAPLTIDSSRIIIGDEKDSGYSSVHLITRLNLSVSRPLRQRLMLPDTWRVPVEIQFRTILEDVWSETQHKIEYKPSTSPVDGSVSGTSVPSRSASKHTLLKVQHAYQDAVETLRVTDRASARLANFKDMVDSTNEYLDQIVEETKLEPFVTGSIGDIRRLCEADAVRDAQLNRIIRNKAKRAGVDPADWIVKLEEFSRGVTDVRDQLSRASEPTKQNELLVKLRTLRNDVASLLKKAGADNALTGFSEKNKQAIRKYYPGIDRFEIYAIGLKALAELSTGPSGAWEALGSYRTLAEREPRNALWRYRTGQALAQAGHVADALKSFTAAAHLMRYDVDGSWPASTGSSEFAAAVYRDIGYQTWRAGEILRESAATERAYGIQELYALNDVADMQLRPPEHFVGAQLQSYYAIRFYQNAVLSNYWSLRAFEEEAIAGGKRIKITDPEKLRSMSKSLNNGAYYAYAILDLIRQCSFTQEQVDESFSDSGVPQVEEWHIASKRAAARSALKCFRDKDALEEYLRHMLSEIMNMIDVKSGDWAWKSFGGTNGDGVVRWAVLDTLCRAWGLLSDVQQAAACAEQVERRLMPPSAEVAAHPLSIREAEALVHAREAIERSRARRPQGGRGTKRGRAQAVKRSARKKSQSA